MTPSNNKNEINEFRGRAAEMIVDEYQFNTNWIRRYGWEVVPVEDGNHFSTEDVAILVPALRAAGYNECIALALEPVGELPICYHLSITEQAFLSFNAECGLMRYLLMDRDRSWAISCNEWYNLFASHPTLLEKMLGKSVESARNEFVNFASALAESPDEPLLRVARHYAML